MRFLVNGHAGADDIQSMNTTVTAATSGITAGNLQSQIAMAVLTQVQDASLQQAEALVKMIQESSGIGQNIDLIA